MHRLIKNKFDSNATALSINTFSTTFSINAQHNDIQYNYTQKKGVFVMPGINGAQLNNTLCAEYCYVECCVSFIGANSGVQKAISEKGHLYKTLLVITLV